MPNISKERERLYRYVKRWGLHDSRTLRQSRKVDKLINKTMIAHLRSRNDNRV
ncbi:MAG: aspartyl-phosphate phosphatase Spo0E family protein [Firmicutes bacterium]|nr:aspartyl-phosphate phosphatase Spo0E family protein [Bacillota bacterium]